MKFPYAEPFETGTAGFTLVDARIAWAFYDGDRTRREAFPDGGNLTNETARLPGVADQGQCATAAASAGCSDHPGAGARSYFRT